MLLFNRILQPPAPAEVPRVERRRSKRFAVNPKFPLKAVLSFIPRDDTGAPMAQSRQGWNWKGRLIDCSELGARIHMGPVPKMEARDECDLMLNVDDFALSVPCQIANIAETAEGLVFGLTHNIEEETTRNAYRQLLDVLALGYTLKLQAKSTKADDSGYLVERYAGDGPSRLTIWRIPSDGAVSAFEFQLKDSLVRGAEGRTIKYLAGSGADFRPASAAKCLEIQRLFNWVLPNLAPAVPEDVQKFLQRFGA
jgi:PilZ domain